MVARQFMSWLLMALIGVAAVTYLLVSLDATDGLVASLATVPALLFLGKVILGSPAAASTGPVVTMSAGTRAAEETVLSSEPARPDDIGELSEPEPGLIGPPDVPPMPGAAPRGGAQLPEDLTPRERQVLTLVAHGRTDADIAALLGLSPDTVSLHIRNAMRKFGGDSHSALALFAREAAPPGS